MKTIKLTETVKKGGCAAKLPAPELKEVLKNLPKVNCKNLVVGPQTMDDAALWDLEDGRYLIQTVDFFTPIVDDPKDFGAIAAANAVSDVYAMGGTPSSALSILCFPATELSLDLLRPMMEGALEVLNKAGVVLAGGHSIDDQTIKLGFSVAGFVKKGREWTNAKAKEGDHLILTKALGTGTITSALKQNRVSEAAVQSATSSMIQLNNVPELIADIEVHACTDITGFGLAGHALQMAQASQQSLKFKTSALPILRGALELIEEGVLNRAHHTNLRYVSDYVEYCDISEPLRWLTLDPQTSGGLLLSVSKNDSAEVVKRLSRHFERVTLVGEVSKRESKLVCFS